MITLNEFIERSKPAWQTARGYIQCFDNPNDPTEFKLGPDDWYWKNKISDMGLNETDVKYHVLFSVSDATKGRVGYKMMHVFLRNKNSVLCVEFINCTEAFLNITTKLGMVNGVAYKSRISLRSDNSEVFFF